jgi:hypothetical protein
MFNKNMNGGIFHNSSGITIPNFSLSISPNPPQWFKSYCCNSYYVSPHFGGETYCFCPIRLSVTQFVSATPLKLLNRISWNLVGSKDTICSCAYYQEISDPQIFVGVIYAPLNLKISRNILLKQLVSTTPLKLLNRISWNLVVSKDTICSCAYYQEILIP